MLGFALAVLGLDLGADGLVAIAGALGAPVTVATAAAVAPPLATPNPRAPTTAAARTAKSVGAAARAWRTRSTPCPTLDSSC